MEKIGNVKKVDFNGKVSYEEGLLIGKSEVKDLIDRMNYKEWILKIRRGLNKEDVKNFDDGMDIYIDMYEDECKGLLKEMEMILNK